MAKLYFEDSKNRPKKDRWTPTYVWWRRVAVISWVISAGLVALRIYG